LLEIRLVTAAGHSRERFLIGNVQPEAATKQRWSLNKTVRNRPHGHNLIGAKCGNVSVNGRPLPLLTTILSGWCPDRIAGEETDMVKSRQQTSRKPATKFTNLQKKLQKQKAPVKKPTGKKK
jgi:hypothetical protein